MTVAIYGRLLFYDHYCWASYSAIGVSNMGTSLGNSMLCIAVTLYQRWTTAAPCVSYSHTCCPNTHLTIPSAQSIFGLFFGKSVNKACAKVTLNRTNNFYAIIEMTKESMKHYYKNNASSQKTFYTILARAKRC